MKLLNLVALSLSLLPAVSGAPLDTSGPSPLVFQRQNQPANQLLSYIFQLFPVNNDVEIGVCGDIVVIFARGTTEPGNVGSLVGPPLFGALRKRMGANGGQTLAVQGVDRYDASVTAYLQGGDASGSQQMADLVSKAMKQCPSSKIVMSGYSQGGQLVHNAARLLPASTMAAVSSVVIFGDPYSRFPVQGASPGKVRIFCHLGDDICVDGDIILLQHLTYFMDVDEAATYILANAK
ncbi:Cutinase [Apiospora kogelbergensis]|uniref:Cutinase n=1 Tax=Apiospora kogelbergensis TaxID=1337665 RepID=A0AAW0QN58_9PEZI